jgi:hypothetical protein
MQIEQDTSARISMLKAGNQGTRLLLQAAKEHISYFN